MASVADICNLALARLGDEASVATIDPPDGSAQAVHCRRFYPLARDTVLTLHTWNFSTRRVALSQYVKPGNVSSWAYAYAVPNQSLHVFAVLPSDALEDNPLEPSPFTVETKDDGAEMILTDVEGAVARYAVRIEDTNKFTPMAVDAMAWLLASHLAGPILKGDAGRSAAQECFSAAMRVIGMARTHDANQRRERRQSEASWIAARA